jgi:hypothetical protein
MAKPKFNVLIMRDDSPVKGFRISRFWIKIFLTFQVVFLILAGLGGWAGYRFSHDAVLLSAENRELTRQLNEANIKLERLQNVERILNTNDPADLQTPIGLPVGTPPEAPPSPLDLSSLLDQADLGQAQIRNMNIQIKRGMVELKFDISNLQTSSTLSGVIRLGLITNTGGFEMPAVKQEDLEFSIQRFKKIRTSFRLPDGLSADGIYALKVSVEKPDGTVILSEPFPFRSHRS